MKISKIPKRGRVDSVIYSEGRYGKVARSYQPPSNPRSPWQQAHRENLRAVSARWHTLSTAQQEAWRGAAARKYFVTDDGRQVRRNCYTLFVGLNTRRADLRLPQFDLPPDEPVFSTNPVVELVAAYTGGRFTLKVRLSGPPAQYTLVQVARPVSAAARWVQHFPFLGLLPPPTDGWCDITDLYVARYGLPKVGQAIWIRTCQHIDGWIDTPKVLRARVLAVAQ